jgi:hypothetical protein
MASSPTSKNLFFGGNPTEPRTVFGTDYQQFLDAGYTADGDYLNPPAN